MAQLIIDIPEDKKDWIINGAALNMGYLDIVLNPDFDDMQVEDPITNPMSIPNPQSKAAFIKATIIKHLKTSAIRGNNMDPLQLLADEAEAINIT